MPEVRNRIRSSIRILSSPGARKLLRRGLWGLCDHGLMSATNFLMMVLLARVLSPRDFGFYALTYTALLFVNGMQAALFTQPYTMLGAPRAGLDLVRYTTDTARLQALFAIVTGLIFIIIALLGARSGWEVASLLLACAPATAAWQMQEFIRRVLYTNSAASRVFYNDVVSYGGQTLLVVLLWQWEALTPVTALLALAGTSLLGVLIGLWQIRADLDWSHLSRIGFRTTAVENWHFGKWLLGGSLAGWTSGRIYPIAAAGMVSVATTGAMKAVQTILGPMNVLIFAIDPLVGPKVARIKNDEGIPALRTFISRIQLLMLFTVCAYCLVVAIFAGAILDRIYGPYYTQYAWLLIVMAINFGFTALRGPLSIALTALGETSALFRVRVASSIINLTLGLAAVYFLGLYGIGVGIMLNGIVLQVATWHFYIKYTGGGSLFHRIRSAVGWGPETKTLEST